MMRVISVSAPLDHLNALGLLVVLLVTWHKYPIWYGFHLVEDAPGGKSQPNQDAPAKGHCANAQPKSVDWLECVVAGQSLCCIVNVVKRATFSNVIFQTIN